MRDFQSSKMGQSLCEIFDKYATLKTKVVQGNHKPFITKKIEKSSSEAISSEKKTDISNNPEIIKLYKNKEIMLLI